MTLPLATRSTAGENGFAIRTLICAVLLLTLSMTGARAELCRLGYRYHHRRQRSGNRRGQCDHCG